MSNQFDRIDAHVHLWNVSSIDRIIELTDLVGLERTGIVCTIDQERVNANPPALACKARYPDRVYIMCGLDHSEEFSGGKVKTLSLSQQVENLISLGADGIKMIEGKPTTRRYLDISVDSPYFAEYFECLEQRQFPVLWHVNDPEEFWDPERIPDWAKERNWGYNETHVQKEDQYKEVDKVLERHAKLLVIFAHFYFLSADLPRAAAFLDRYENVHFDLAPGIEMLYNMSRSIDESRDFFIKYADRIVFGTDISSGITNEEAGARAGIITRWLETADEYRVSPEADFLLGKPEHGIMRGLSLPEQVLEKIYHTNYERIAGVKPRALDISKAAQECRRIASIAQEPSEAAAAAEVIEGSGTSAF